MSTRDAKLRVAIEGEQQYKQALSELNKGNQVLASEIKKLAAEYKGNENSIEALNAKGDLLQRQLLQQKDKVATLREALAYAVEKYGEADTRTQEWQIQLNRAETAEINLEHAIKENNEALANSGKITLTVGDAVGNLASKLGINLPKAATDALNGTVAFSTGAVAAFGTAAAGAKALIDVMKALHHMTLDAAADADDLLTRSITSGLSVRELQALNYASPFIDVDVSTLESTYSRMPKIIAQAASQYEVFDRALKEAISSGKKFNNTLGEQAAAFDSLGISIYDDDGALRDYHEILDEVIPALGEMGDTTEAAALAQTLLGKSYTDLKPLMQNYGEMQRILNEAMAEGYFLDENQIQILGELDDAHEKMQLRIETGEKLLALGFAPASKAAMETFGQAVKQASQELAQSGVVEDLVSLVTSTVSLYDSASALIDAMPGWLNPITQVSNAFRGLAVIMATIADAANVVIGLTTLDFNRAKTGLGWNISNGQLSNLQQLQRSGSEYVSYNAAGTQDWRGGLTWVGENGPELVSLPQGSRVYPNQESRNMGAGDIYNINVQNIEEMQQFLDFLKSLRVRRRM